MGISKTPAADLYSQLLSLIREYSSRTNRLPPEEKLAETLGISRVKLRDVLSALESNGYISRKKGVGTIINDFLLKEPARLDIDSIFSEVVEECGHQAKVYIRRISLLTNAPDQVTESLHLSSSSSVYCVEKIITSDDTPAIYLKDYIPSQYYNKETVNLELLAKSTYAFIQDYCDERIENTLSRVSAVAAKGEVADALKVAAGAPILSLYTESYTLKRTPIVCTAEYYNTDLLPYCIHKRQYRTRDYLAR